STGSDNPGGCDGSSSAHSLLSTQQCPSVVSYDGCTPSALIVSSLCALTAGVPFGAVVAHGGSRSWGGVHQPAAASRTALATTDAPLVQVASSDAAAADQEVKVLRTVSRPNNWYQSWCHLAATQRSALPHACGRALRSWILGGAGGGTRTHGLRVT